MVGVGYYECRKPLFIVCAESIFIDSVFSDYFFIFLYIKRRRMNDDEGGVFIKDVSNKNM
jgi:hypothetical protein